MKKTINGYEFDILNTVPNEPIITLNGEHWVVTAITLNAFTDEIDTLTHTKQFHMFRRNIVQKMTGDIFFLEDALHGDAFVIISESPDFFKPELLVKGARVTLLNGTNPAAICKCRAGECEKVCRLYSKDARNGAKLITMSNTWGDRNCDTRVCEEFVLKEIDKAAELNVDIVQIDDGWQLHSTEDLTRRDEQDRRIFDEDFWQVNPTRFPNGIKPLAEYAAKKGVKIGLWFAPDSRDAFAARDRDVKILKNAYDNWGVRFFKLDMYWIQSDAERDGFLDLLCKIYSFGDDVAVQLDVTRFDRINYLCGKQYGTAFVENRYTKLRSVFPYRTLKNIWMLGKYIPTSKCQFELVNPDLNTECYLEDDIFAPKYYDLDYQFAAVMLSNPLFWMEIQFLSDERVNELNRIMPVWQANRDAFSRADVMPIGDQPSGRSFSGFYVDAKDDEYLLLFREATAENTFEFTAPIKGCDFDVLATNKGANVKINGQKITAEFGNENTYILLKLK